MLGSLRKNAKYFYFLFGVIILSFVLWVPGMNDNNSQQGLAVAIIGDEEITLDEFWRSYDRAEDLYRDIYKEKYDDSMRDGLKQEVLMSLVESRILTIAATHAGISVTDQELNDSILADPTFHKDGAFSSDFYRNILRANRLNPARYEESKRNDLLRMKMRSIYMSAVSLSPTELENIPADSSIRDAMSEALLREKRLGALVSFVNAYKDTLKVQINRDLIL